MSFFEKDPPPELDARVMRAAGEALAGNRKALRRRSFLQWFLVPSFTTAAILLSLRARKEEVPNAQLAEFADWDEVAEQDYAAIEDLEIGEDLETLENWEDA